MALFGLGAKSAKPLRLIAQETEDLAALAALVQDGALCAGDMAYDVTGKHFTLRMNRFCHEAESPVPLRAPSVLRLSCVTKVQMRGFDPRQSGLALSLLDIAVEPGDPPAQCSDPAFRRRRQPGCAHRGRMHRRPPARPGRAAPRQVEPEAWRVNMHLARIDIDEASLTSPSDKVEHERKIAIFDLVEKNSFTPEGAAEAGSEGPFDLRLGLEDNRLVFDISAPDFARRIMLSLAPFKAMMRDYQMICDSYYDAPQERHTLSNRGHRHGPARHSQ